MLILFCMFSTNVFAERQANSTLESDLLDIVSDNSTSFAIPLIEQGIAVDITDKNGQSLLMLAAQNNNKELVKLLVEKGANPNYEITDSNIETLIGKTVLEFGANTDDPEMIDLLLESGAKLNVTNGDLNSIAANAYKEGHLKMLRYLLRKGAKILDRTGQYLVVDQILNEVNTTDTIRLNTGKRIIRDKDKGFKLIKALDDNGIPLDNKTLSKSKFITTSTEKSKVEDYMSTYRQKIVDGMPNEEIVEVIDDTKDKPKYIYTHEEEVIPKWKFFLRFIFLCIKEGFLLFLPLIIIIVIILTIFEVISGYYICRSIYNKIFSFFQKTFKNIRNWLTTKIYTSIRNKEKSIILRTNMFKLIDSSEKGWTVDDTIELEVNYLTIEDIINPIRMANQHERLVREMIWYVRKVEKTNVDKKEACDMLTSKWKQVNPKQVRSIYKRSLLVILENYSKQNSKLKQLSKKVKAK